MKLFHGSNVEVTVPDLAKSKPYKDFGQENYETYRGTNKDDARGYVR